MTESRIKIDLVERLTDRDAIAVGGLFYAVPAMREAAAELRVARARIALLENSRSVLQDQLVAALAHSAAAEAFAAIAAATDIEDIEAMSMAAFAVHAANSKIHVFPWTCQDEKDREVWRAGIRAALAIGRGTADELARLQKQLALRTAALRTHAIVMIDGTAHGTMFVMHCKECGSEWPVGGTESHQDQCRATVL